MYDHHSVLLNYFLISAHLCALANMLLMMAMNCMILSSRWRSSNPLKRYVCFLPSDPIMDIFFGLVFVGSTATSKVKDSKVTGYGRRRAQGCELTNREAVLSLHITAYYTAYHCILHCISLHTTLHITAYYIAYHCISLHTTLHITAYYTAYHNILHKPPTIWFHTVVLHISSHNTHTAAKKLHWLSKFFQMLHLLTPLTSSSWL